MTLVVFDMDGTLIDTQHDITASINHVRAQHYGLPPLQSSFVVEAINREERNLADLFYHTLHYEDAAKALFETHYYEQCIQSPRLYEGIKGVLEALKERKIALSVATNAPSPFAKRMMAHLGIDAYFDCIVGADMVEVPKPNPQMLHKIFEYYGFDPKAHLGYMVGDNSKDIGVAANAGIASIFATWGFSSEGKGDHVCHHPLDLLKII